MKRKMQKHNEMIKKMQKDREDSKGIVGFYLLFSDKDIFPSFESKIEFLKKSMPKFSGMKIWVGSNDIQNEMKNLGANSILTPHFHENASFLLL